MHKYQQKLLLFVVLIGLALVLFFVIRSCQVTSEDRAEKWAQNLQKELNIVVEYLATYEYPKILIKEADGTMLLLLSETVSIEDEEVVAAVDNLFSQGIKSISKNQEDNAIVFLKLTRNSFGAGLVYSIDSTNDPKVQFLTKLEPLSEKGWYYYEEDFNEWQSD